MISLQNRFFQVISSWEKPHILYYGLISMLVVIFIGKSLESNLLGNLQLLTTSMATIGIVAAGQTLVVITGGIDLSVAAVVGLTGMLTAYLTTIGIDPLGTFNPWLAAMVALGVATGVGWVNGTLISRYKLAPFIATFGMLNLLRGAAGLLSNGTPINLRGSAFDWMWARLFGVIPVPALLLLLVFMMIAYLLKNSRYGRYAYAIGSNENVAHLSGVNVELTRQVIYAMSGFLAGLSGLLLLSLIKGGAYQNGQYYELFSIAAVIIGGTSLRGGRGGVWGTLGGVLLMAMIRNGLILFSVPPLWNEMITGFVIIVAALVDIQRQQITGSAPISRPAITTTTPLPVVQRSNTLNQALKQFTQTLEKRFALDGLTIYLQQRETDRLVKPDGERCATGTLAAHVAQTGRPMMIGDIRLPTDFVIPSLKPDIRTAVAVPILREDRLIGVVELYSVSPNAFHPTELEVMVNLCSQICGGIEDNWLLEIGWLTRQIRDALRNLADDAALEKSELGGWFFLDSSMRGILLRKLLEEAIDYLYSETVDTSSRTHRRYQILRQTYVDRKHVDSIVRDLNLSRRQYFYDLKEGIDAVTHYIFTQHQQLCERENGVATILS